EFLFQAASARTSCLVTLRPSSERRRFSRRMRREYGRCLVEMPCLSRASRRKISYSFLPTLRRERDLKLFKDMMAFLMKDAARRMAPHSGMERISEPSSLVVFR